MKRVKFILFSFCFLSIFQLSAQVKIGLNFYPAFSFPVYQNPSNPVRQVEYNAFFKEVLTYSGGVELRMPIAKKLDFSIGLNYASTGHQFDYEKATELFFYTVKPDFPKQTKMIRQYFEIPVGFTKYFGNNSTPYFSISVSSGIRYALSIWEIISYEKGDYREKEKVNLGNLTNERTFTYPVALGFNFYIPVSNKILWEIGPAITYHFPGIIKEGDAQLNFFQAGVSTAVLFN